MNYPSLFPLIPALILASKQGVQKMAHMHILISSVHERHDVSSNF